jgi:hypothetical protein
MKTKFICSDGKECLISDCLKKCRIVREYDDETIFKVNALTKLGSLPSELNQLIEDRMDNRPSRCASLPFILKAAESRTWSGKPSVTQLLNGTRESYLKITHDYSEKPYDLAFAILGTGSHTCLEQQNDKLMQLGVKYLAEERFEFAGITGQMDLLLKEDGGEWELHDYKTSGSYKIAKALGLRKVSTDILDDNGNPVKYKNGKVKKDITFEVDPMERDVWEWAMQQNFYKIIIENSVEIERRMGEKIKIKRAYIQGIPRDGGTYTAKGYGITEKGYLIRLPFMPQDDVIAYFKGKGDELLRSLEKDELPPICSDKECWNGIKCERYCPVWNLCERGQIARSNLEG